MKKLVTASFITTALTGCVNQFASMPDHKNVQNPVIFTEQYAVASEKGLINPLAFVGGRDDTQLYDKYRKSWCAVDNTGPKLLTRQLTKICDSNGGSVIEAWCVHRSSELPLFKMDIGYSTLKCSTGTSTYAEVISPKDNEINGTEWHQLAKNDGFITHQEQQKLIEQNKKTSDEAIAKYKLEEQRKHELKLEENKRILSTIGLRICQSGSGGAKYVGFVEDFTDSKMKVNVAHYGGNGWTVSGFTPNTIWDYPKNWYICE